jgi:hypothetical protein
MKRGRSESESGEREVAARVAALPREELERVVLEAVLARSRVALPLVNSKSNSKNKNKNDDDDDDDGKSNSKSKNKNKNDDDDDKPIGNAAFGAFGALSKVLLARVLEYVPEDQRGALLSMLDPALTKEGIFFRRVRVADEQLFTFPTWTGQLLCTHLELVANRVTHRRVDFWFMTRSVDATTIKCEQEEKKEKLF